MDRAEIEFIYIGDTMCSWCWGFAPTVEELRLHYAFPMRLVNGGLRPGDNSQVIDSNLRATLLHHWDQVAAATGQPFDESILARDGWVYDTELPARAVAVMRQIAPDHEWAWFKRLQRAFYAEAIDITDASVYPTLLPDLSVDASKFMSELESDASRLAAWADFEQARVFQAHGFPTLLVRTGKDLATVTRGYRPFGDIESHLTGYLAERYEPISFLSQTVTG